jgi:hypothetical protein
MQALNTSTASLLLPGRYSEKEERAALLNKSVMNVAIVSVEFDVRLSWWWHATIIRKVNKKSLTL